MTRESLRDTSLLTTVSLFASLLFVIFNVSAAIWSSPTQISQGAWADGSAYMTPSITVDGLNVYAVWVDGRENLDLDYNLYFANSSDGGTTWQPDRRVDTIGFYDSKPKLVANGSELHIVLEESNTFWHIHSTDGGTTWQNESLVSRGWDVEDFDLAMEYNDLYLVWSEWNFSAQSYDLYLVKSTDLGDSWSVPSFIVNVTESHAYMDLDVSEGWLHAVCDGGYIRSNDAGNTWDSLNGTLNGTYLSADGHNIHLMRGNAYGLYGYMRSDDYGDTWSPLNTSIKGKISSTGWVVYVVHGSKYFLSTTGGLAFEDSGLIPDISPVSPYTSSVAVDESGIAHFAYVEYVVGEGHIEIFYVRSGSPYWPPDFGPFPPTEPLNLTAVPGNRQVTLTWEPPAQDFGWSVTNYMIYRGLTQGEWTFLHVVGDLLSYTDNDVTNGVTYWYIVTAGNRAGYGAWSTEVSATPTNQHPVCSMVSLTDGATVSGALVISGTATDSDGEVERVEVRIDDGPWTNATGTDAWSFDWDTMTYAEGHHSIHARSFDGEDYSDAVEVSVWVEQVHIDGDPVVFGLPV